VIVDGVAIVVVVVAAEVAAGQPKIQSLVVAVALNVASCAHRCS